MEGAQQTIVLNETLLFADIFQVNNLLFPSCVFRFRSLHLLLC